MRDLDRTREFYCEVFGLVVSSQEADMLYLRGVDEVCHHSLVFRRSAEPARCERVGLRVLSEAELDKVAGGARVNSELENVVSNSSALGS